MRDSVNLAPFDLPQTITRLHPPPLRNPPNFSFGSVVSYAALLSRSLFSVNVDLASRWETRNVKEEEEEEEEGACLMDGDEWYINF